LKRTRIVTILLGDLAVGTWRNLRTEEVKELVRVVEPSIAEMDFND
jgi:16S rRNA U516 pseudouridylate synthase RsuA-like enzyme